MRPDAIYTNGVVSKAVQSVYADGMAMRRVSARMARDFWVQPSEGAVRSWCRNYSATFDFAADYQSWVVSEFSGILCVDEVYQDKLALLLAVDPAAPDGDRLIGYQLVHGPVNTIDVHAFLTSLKNVGVEPEEVITDGSKLYPSVLSAVWPTAAHQLCLFHETRHVTSAVLKLLTAIRRQLPHPPPATGTRGGPLRGHPPSSDPSDPAARRWYWRQIQRRNQIAHVHELAQQGLSQRAITRQTGYHRRTVKQWLAEPIPPLPTDLPGDASLMAPLPTVQQRRLEQQQRKVQVHRLAQEGFSYSAIARQVGIHRITVKTWLEQEPPSIPEEEEPAPEHSENPPPPPPWSNWDEVRRIREALRGHRFLFVRRPENRSPEEQQEIEILLASPVGAELQVAYSFLVEWYRLWTDEHRQRRTLADAQARYDAWRINVTYRALPQLRRVQDRMTASKFDQLSQFLRNPEWESTNNGAERAGRAFRHRQAPHFNLRTEVSIDNALKQIAYHRHPRRIQSSMQRFHTCQRGRKPQQRATAEPPACGLPSHI